MKNIISKSSNQTKKFAALLAKKIFKAGSLKRKAIVLALIGELGSGKTTFVQGFLKSLGLKQRITSPTFLIFRPYTLKAKRYTLVYHVDCYRIQKPEELLKLGFNKILANPKNIVLIEWAEKILPLLPKETIRLEFTHGRKENERLITY